jgi:hypothetical protein
VLELEESSGEWVLQKCIVVVVVVVGGGTVHRHWRLDRHQGVKALRGSKKKVQTRGKRKAKTKKKKRNKI